MPDFNSEITPELAEICGIHAGDGYLRKRKNCSVELDISGGIEEKDYYDRHVAQLFKNAFDVEIKPRFFKHRNTYGFITSNKMIAEKLHSFGFPFGKKTLTVAVPKPILESRNLDIIYSFLRGVFDTDGCVYFRKRAGSGYSEVFLKRHTYPIISISVCSKSLWAGICTLLKKTGFQFSVSFQAAKGNENKKYSIALRGDAAILNWIGNIGFKNPLKFNRFLIWKRFGFVPPELTFSEQQNILSRKKNPQDFYSDKLSDKDTFIPSMTKRRFLFVENFGSFIPND